MDDALKEVFAIFRDELQELGAAASSALLGADAAADTHARRQHLETVYRAFHSIKGSAGSLGISDVEELAHALETALSPFRSGQAQLTATVVQAALQAVDLAQLRVAALVGGDDRADPAIAMLTERLARAAELGDTASPSSSATAAASAAPARAGANVPTRAEEPVALASDRTIRVAVDRLALIDRQVDELREERSALEQRAEELKRIFRRVELAYTTREGGLDRDHTRALRDDLLQLQRHLTAGVIELGARLTALDEELRAVRMLPVGSVLRPLERAVWEQAAATAKQARLEINGGDVALDRRILEALKDPFVHLVRNAVDHGIETPSARSAAGKPETGSLRIDVDQRGGEVEIVFADDGAGIDLDRVRRTAIARGLVSADAAERLDAEDAYELLFAPGFSTASEVSRTSGRGVGLDVVRENLQRIGGRISISSQPGKGTRFAISVPLTLATAQVLLVESGAYVLAVPLTSVMRSRFRSSAEVAAQPRRIDFEGQPLVLHELPALLGYDGAAPLDAHAQVVVVLRSADRLLAVRVDRLHGEREIVVRPLPPELARLRQLSSAASLGDGRLAFVVSARGLIEAADGSSAAAVDAAPAARPASRRVRRVVVADDSVSTRSLHRQVLEAAGYQVVTAVDGEDALRQLREGGGADLVVSDVQMPRLDGLGLARRIRADAALKDIPVVLISSLDADEDRQRALAAGASAYLPKQHYRRGEMLELVRRLFAQ